MAGPKPLSPKQLKFVELYVGGATATDAYTRAGYKAKRGAAKTNAARLRNHPAVAAAIDAARARGLQAADLTAERLTLEIARLSTSDPRRLKHPDGRWKDLLELDDDTAACVASIEYEMVEQKGKDGKVTVVPAVKRIKLWDKNAALKTGVAVLGMVVERKEITGRRGGPIVVNLAGLSDADLDALDAILARAAAGGGADAGAGEGREGAAPAG